MCIAKKNWYFHFSICRGVASYGTLDLPPNCGATVRQKCAKFAASSTWSLFSRYFFCVSQYNRVTDGYMSELLSKFPWDWHQLISANKKNRVRKTAILFTPLAVCTLRRRHILLLDFMYHLSTFLSLQLIFLQSIFPNKHYLKVHQLLLSFILNFCFYFYFYFQPFDIIIISFNSQYLAPFVLRNIKIIISCTVSG